MPNMSYCRFQNTLRDLKECYDNWYGDREDDEDEPLSAEELRARERLLDLCRRIYDEHSDD